MRANPGIDPDGTCLVCRAPGNEFHRPGCTRAKRIAHDNDGRDGLKVVAGPPRRVIVSPGVMKLLKADSHELAPLVTPDPAMVGQIGGPWQGLPVVVACCLDGVVAYPNRCPWKSQHERAEFADAVEDLKAEAGKPAERFLAWLLRGGRK